MSVVQLKYCVRTYRRIDECNKLYGKIIEANLRKEKKNKVLDKKYVYVNCESG